MNRHLIRRIVSVFLFFILFLSIPGPSFAHPVSLDISESDLLCEQILQTYKEAKTLSRRRSFSGYCATYVNWQLVILGINAEYIYGDGNVEYSNYCRSTTSTGGYQIQAYPKKKYSLQDALYEISDSGTKNVYNILIGFKRGLGYDGQLYGHTVFIHAIQGGMVYYSESSDWTIDGVVYKEGTPIVLCIEQFCNQYLSFSLDGVIHFIGDKELSDETRFYGYIYGGDVSGDLKIDTIDYLILKRLVLGTTDVLQESSLNAADVNRDGVINTYDYVTLKRYLLGAQ